MSLSASRSLTHKGDVLAQRYDCVGATAFGAAYTIYKSAVVKIDVSSSDGYVQHKRSAAASVAGDKFVGLALEKVVIAQGDTADGAKNILVAQSGLWAFPKGSFVVADLFENVYASDDNTLTLTSTNNLWIGTIHAIDSTNVWVDISKAAGRANSPT